jgi:hypothetical protein
MSFEEVALVLWGLFLLIVPFGRLEHLICKILESIAVSGLVLSLGVKIQMQSRKPSNSPSLGRYFLLRHGRSTALAEWFAFLFLSWPLDELSWSMWPNSFFCSLVSRVNSSAMVYLLAIANICLDVLGFFMVSLHIKDESLSPFLKNIIIDLSSTFGMRFLLLQKHWMNSQSESHFFWTMLARSHLTPSHAHMA